MATVGLVKLSYCVIGYKAREHLYNGVRIPLRALIIVYNFLFLPFYGSNCTDQRKVSDGRKVSEDGRPAVVLFLDVHLMY
jgi:hypothetical protein